MATHSTDAYFTQDEKVELQLGVLGALKDVRLMIKDCELYNAPAETRRRHKARLEELVALERKIHQMPTKETA